MALAYGLDSTMTTAIRKSTGIAEVYQPNQRTSEQSARHVQISWAPPPPNSSHALTILDQPLRNEMELALEAAMEADDEGQVQELVAPGGISCAVLKTKMIELCPGRRGRQKQKQVEQNIQK